jgi:hypothetical protein
MAKKKAILTGDTLFPRSFKNELCRGNTQPYVTGLYLALTVKTLEGEEFTQSGIDWDGFSTFSHNVQANCKEEDIVMCRLGDYLSQDEIDLIN